MIQIPDQAYFTIGEVSSLCQIKPHVLRYWEQEFKQLSPTRRGNRRYYQREDVLKIIQIRSLLYEQGFTIQGAKQQLADMQFAGRTKMQAAVIANIVSELEAIEATLSMPVDELSAGISAILAEQESASQNTEMDDAPEETDEAQQTIAFTMLPEALD